MIADTLPAFDLGQIPLGRVGTPEEIANSDVSHTGRFLKPMLK